MATIQLAVLTPSSDDVPFTTPANYTFPATIEVVGGKAKLKSSVASSKNWTFITPANYTYNSAKIEITGGVARPKGIPIVPHVWYHLNESSGATVNDTSGNGRNGTCVNMEDGDWIGGKLNNCLRFNEGGTKDEYVNCGNIASYERTDAFSIEFWIKILGPSDSGVIRVLFKYSTTGYLIYIQNQHVYMFLSGGGTNRIIVHGNANVQDGNWRHIICTYDGSSSASGVNIYVDGVLDTMATDSDALTFSMLTSVNLELSDNAPSYFLNGYLDEVVIYDEELTASEVSNRYNSGNGTENAVGGYATDNPMVVSNNGHVFNNPLNIFTETATKPAGSELKYHVSSDNGATWKYWNGSIWTPTDDSYAQSNLASVIHTNLNTLASSGTFKHRSLHHSDNGSVRSELDNIYIAENATFTIGSHEISMNFDITPANIIKYLTITETITKPANTNIEYQYSINGGVSYNGSWLIFSALEIAFLLITCHFDGTDKIRFKFQLSTTDNSVTPEIDNLNFTGHTGYETSGSYEITIHYSGYMSWKNITFDLIIPVLTTAKVYTKNANIVIDPQYKYVERQNNEDMDLEGMYLQWKLELTGNGAKTPILNWLEIEYYLGYLSVYQQDLINENIIRFHQ